VSARAVRMEFMLADAASSEDSSPGCAERLAELGAQGLLRSLRTIESGQGAYVVLNGRRLCNLSSNDYLGLAGHPYICEAVKKAVDAWGWGAGASRLVCGTLQPHTDLESRLARFKGTQAALVCSTGYLANLAAIRGLAGRGDVILIDKLDHASIIDAAFAGGPAGGGAPEVRVFPHRDYARLGRLLQKAASARRRIIVTDSLFSMDGDMANLSTLVELKTYYGAMLVIDEAHATGVWGEHGRGVAEAMGVEAGIDVVVGTLSKALGGVGGFIAASREIIDWLINTARSFIYTTALPAAACAAAMAAVDLVDREPERRRHVLNLAKHLRTELGERRGWNIGESCSQIVPLIVGTPEQAMGLSRRLEEEGFLVPAIRPPTVPAGTARLRISLSAEHQDSDVEALVAALDRHFKVA
jgi:8-amino-7-oxononanoate synthase